MKQPSRPTVLITGSSSGFGLLSVHKFHQQGWNVIATLRSPEKAPELTELENVLVLPLNVTNRDQIESAVNQAVQHFGRIDALVNNAGYGTAGLLEEASEEEVRSQMETNFFGVVNMIQAVLPVMREQQSGTIINVTSMAGSIAPPLLSLYSASKFAVEGLSESLSYELKPLGISIKTVAPGAFKTGFGNAVNFLSGNAKPELSEYSSTLKSNIASAMASPPKPFGFGDPREVADLIYKCATEKPSGTLHYVGKDARLIARLRRLLPYRVIRRMMEKSLMPSQ
ncbi:SDR family oxidoreductase [Spongorhabdus nitratireducens]